jgi:hypothetical protein
MDNEFADHRAEFFKQCHLLFKEGVDMQDEAAVRKAWTETFNGPDTCWKDHDWRGHPPWFTVHHLSVRGDRYYDPEAATAAEERWLNAIVQEAKQWSHKAAKKETAV